MFCGFAIAINKNKFSFHVCIEICRSQFIGKIFSSKERFSRDTSRCTPCTFKMYPWQEVEEGYMAYVSLWIPLI